MTKIIKIAKIDDDEIATPEDIAAYVQSLKLYLNRKQVKNSDLQEKIKMLPSPKRILKHMSMEEIRILTEVVGYIWKEITKNNIIEESKMTRAPDKLMGNYLIISKGVLLSGPNHFTIIKQNLNLFRTLLDINAFAMHEKMSGNPNDLIKLIIDHGAIRIFINKNKQSFFQLTDETYSKWGKKKIQKYEFKNKIVKIIDKRQHYKGWESGIVVILP